MVSLVDFLNERGVDSSFDSRTELWQQFRPNEEYQGTAAQNTALLNQFQQDELIPNLELTASVFDVGASVEARVISGASVLIETSLGSRSFNADRGEVVSLGIAGEFGGFPIRIINGLFSREGALLFLPEAIDKVTTEILEGEYQAIKKF